MSVFKSQTRNYRRFDLKTKGLSGLMLVSLIFSPTASILIPRQATAQTTGLPTSATPGLSFTSQLSSDLQQRQQLNQQADQNAKQQLAQQQKKDEEECIKELGLNALGGGLSLGSLDSTIQSGFQGLLGNMSDNIKDNLTGEINELLGRELEEKLSASVKEVLLAQLKNLLQQQLPNIIKQRLQQEITAGRTPNREEITEIIEQEIIKLINSNLPQLLSVAVKNSTARIITDALGSKLSTIITQAVTQGVGQTTNHLDDTMTELGIFDNIRTIFNNNLLGQNNASATPDRINNLNNAFIEKLQNLAGQVLQTDQISQLLINQISSQLGNSLDADSLNNSLAGVADDISSQLDSLDDSFFNALENSLDGSLDAVAGQLESSLDQLIDPITNSLANLPDQLISPIIQSVEGSLNDVLGTVTGIPLEVINQVTNQLTGSIQGLTDNLVSSITTPITESINGIMDSVTDSIVTPLTDTISGFTDQLTGTLMSPVTGAMESITGIIADPLGTFTRVPTNSYENPASHLSKTSDAIKQENVEMRKLLIKTCMHVKATRRIQTRIEKKEFEDDPKASRDAMAKVMKYNEEVMNYLNEGRKELDQNGESSGPLYTKNLSEDIKQNSQEASGLIIGQVENSGNAFANEVAEALKRDQNKTLQSVLKSSLDRSTIEALANNPRSMPEEDFMLAFAEYFKPQNNPYGSYLLAKQVENEKTVTVSQNTRDEYVAGAGFKDNRECAEVDEQTGLCRRWETITPAVINRDIASQVMQTRQDRALQATESGDLNPGDEPTVEEIVNFKPSSKGGGSGFSGMGLELITNLISQLGEMFGNLGDNTANNSNNSTNQTSISIQTNKNIFGSLAVISWSSPTAQKCSAVNYWPSQSNNQLRFLKQPGDLIDTTGSQIVVLPLLSNVQLSLERQGIKTTMSTDQQLLSSGVKQQSQLSFNSDIQAGDKYLLAFTDLNINIEIKADDNSSTKLIEKIKNQINNQAILTKIYDFSYDHGQGKISISPKVVYNIHCLAGNRNANASITLP